MKANPLIGIIGLVLFAYNTYSQTELKKTNIGESKKDSLAKSAFVITPRINSAGYFPFTGAYLNRHLNADLNVFYNRKAYGFFIFKSLDLEDPHSIVNYLQPGIFKNLNISTKFKARAFFGYVFSQTSGFKDNDSDYYAAVSLYWDITKRIRLENTYLFFDLSTSEKLANRLFISYLLKDFKIEIYLWHRVVFEDSSSALSTSLAVNFPKIKLSEKLFIQNTLSYMGYLTEFKPNFAMRDGFLFSIAFPFTQNK